MRLEVGDCVYEVFLVDDGTLDTVLTINGNEVRLSTDYACNFRNEDGSLSDKGLKELALEEINMDWEGRLQ